MRHCFVTGMTAMLLWSVSTINAAAQAPAEAFASGEALLDKGKIAEALESFTAAARGDRNNVAYVQRYAMLRRIVELRNRLEHEQDATQWVYMAKALRAFYVKERLYDELLGIDTRIHARLGNADSATMLAETQLTLGRNEESLATLSASNQEPVPVLAQALRGIALARLGRGDEAKRIAEALDVPRDAGPNVIYAAARLQGSVGNAADATRLLTRCFETTLPSMLDGFKAHARTCPEFSTMASTSEFASALATPSKMPESKCSGASSCAGCPMSGRCPSSQR